MTTDLAIRDERYLATIPTMADQFARSGMCPDQFRGKPDDVAVVAYSLAALGVRLSFPTLSQCYVVHGKPGLMAQLQTALAGREGIDIRPKTDAHGRPLYDDKTGIVEVRLPGQPPVDVQFTMEEAQRAGLTKPAKSGEPSMYTKWPTNMLLARATTRAISWYAPAAKLGLSSAGVVDIDDLDTVDGPTGGGPTESLTTASAGPPPPPVVNPDGTTITEPLKEPAIDDDLRAELILTLERMPEPVLAQVRDAARELGIPNLKTHRVTKAHGALVQRLIREAELATLSAGPGHNNEAAAAPSMPPAAAPGPAGEPDDGDPFAGPTPDHVHDDAPESAGVGDDGRPFE